MERETYKIKMDYKDPADSHIIADGLITIMIFKHILHLVDHNSH